MPVKKSESRQRLWAFADQGVVSLGNFVTTLLLARALKPSEFGVFSVLFASILFLNTIHAALVTYPLSIFGAPMPAAGLKDWTTKAIVGTLALNGVLISCMCLICLAVSHPELIPAVCLAMLAWQLQETTRMGFFAHLRQKHALPGDAVSYLGQALLIAVLWHSGMLTVKMAFAFIALSSAVAFGLQVAQFGLSPPMLSSWRDFAKASRELGTWGLPARIATLFTLQAFPWVLFYTHGAASAGIFQAVGSSVAVSNPVVFSTCNLITATMAGSPGRERFVRSFRHALYGLAVIAPYFVIALIVPHLILRIFYGAGSPYVDETEALRIMVLGYSLQAVALMASCVIGGLAKTRSLFHMQLVGMAAALLFGLPPAAIFGVAAAALGFTIVQGLQVIYGVHTCRRLFAQTEQHQSVEV
jgi:hypothetical protein